MRHPPTCFSAFPVADAGFNRHRPALPGEQRLKPPPATENRLKPVRSPSAFLLPLLILIGVPIVVSSQAVGVALVIAMLITQAAATQLLTRRRSYGCLHLWAGAERALAVVAEAAGWGGVA